VKDSSRVPRVKIVGVGLLGTSLGLALAKHGITAQLEDQSKANLRLAIEYGAGVAASGEVDLVVVCVPPDLTADVVVSQLEKHPNAVVTDVASVKSSIASQVELQTKEASRYIGSHPMAGREKGGPASGRADLFFARPWVIAPRPDNPQTAIDLISDLAMRIGALVSVMSVEEHDDAVALVSHLPQLISSLLAGSLNQGTTEQLALAGQGLRDTARIAGSDPDLWVQIFSQNARSIGPLVASLKLELEKLDSAISNIDQSGSLAVIHSALAAGNQGIAQIPGKHGGKFLEYQQVTVVIDDSPGALAALLTFVGEIGVNIEDLALEHSPGAAIGLVELQILPSSAQHLIDSLVSNGWRLV
jgi:prephenate dehydrogenase